MDTQLPGNASRRTRQAHQEGGQHPVRERPLALVEQGRGEVVEGPLAAVALGALASRSLVVCHPGSAVLALAPGTLERTILPPERMDGGVTLIGVEELGEV